MLETKQLRKAGTSGKKQKIFSHGFTRINTDKKKQILTQRLQRKTEE